MKPWVCTLCLAAAMLAGVPGARADKEDTKKGPAGGRTVERTLERDGGTRTYRLHLPRDFTKGKPVPLVIALHGMATDGRIMEILTGFDELSDRKGFAVVYPDGVNKVWRFWANDDVHFLKALMDELGQEGLVDAKRIYVTGLSNGAFMTNKLGISLTDRIAAVAPVAGTMARDKNDQLKPRRPLPVLYIHGTDDRIVGIDGKDMFSKMALSLSADECVRWWAKHNGCGDKPTIDVLADKAADGTTVERARYLPEKDGAEVVYCKVVKGGHTWPGGSFQPEFLLGKTCRDINASEMMWEFFSGHRLK